MRSKGIIRCMLLILAILFVVATIPSLAQAVVQHGVALSKGCDVVRVCDTNADCDDGNVCTNDVCDDTLPNVVLCESVTAYNDQAGDTVEIRRAMDVLNCSLDNPQCPVTYCIGSAVWPCPAGSVPMTIVAATGNTTCVAGGSLPCTMGPNIGNGAGLVTFRMTGYNPNLNDVALPGSLIGDQVELKVFDLCNGGIDTAACVAAPNRTATTEFSSPLVDACEHTPQPSLACPDTGNPCTEAGCNEAGVCDQNHVINPSLNANCPDDGNPCTQSGCNAAGVCVGNHVTTPSLNANCPDDGLDCTESGCNAAGVCVFNHVVTPSLDAGCPDDGNPCTESGCSEAGVCDPSHVEIPCEGICRTPGFWGTHAGTEKKNSQNITQTVINACGGSLDVCGECINATVPINNAASAVEATCVNIKAAKRLQLARQLTAAALNCCISGSGNDCTGLDIWDEVFGFCNEVCALDPTNSSGYFGICIDALDCLNNGGNIIDVVDSTVQCQTGTCEPTDTVGVDGLVQQCGKNLPACPEFYECVPLENTCHDRDLCPDATDDGEINGSALCFEPPGPAGSSNACNSAIENTCKVIGQGEANCGTDSCP